MAARGAHQHESGVTSRQPRVIQCLGIGLAQARDGGGAQQGVDARLGVALGTADLRRQAPVEAQQRLLQGLGRAPRRRRVLVIELGQRAPFGLQRPLARLLLARRDRQGLGRFNGGLSLRRSQPCCTNDATSRGMRSRHRA